MHADKMSLISLRGRNNVRALVIFQILFVALQVFVFYPCWQKAPSSTIFIGSRNSEPKSPSYQQTDMKQPAIPDTLPGDNLIDSAKDIVNSVKNTLAEHVKIEQQGNVPKAQRVGLQSNVAKDAAGQIKGTLHNIMNKINPVYNFNGQKSHEPDGQGEVVKGQTPDQQEVEKQEQRKQLELQHSKMLEKQQLLHNKVGKGTKYNSSWESLDTRPLPRWYDAAKIGVFIHWGVFSVPSYSVSGTKGLAEWFWFYWKSDQFVQPIDAGSKAKFSGFLSRRAAAIQSVKDFVAKTYPQKWHYTDFAHQFKAEFFDPQHWAKVFKQSGAKYVVFTSKHHEGYTLWPSKKSWNWNAADIGPNRDLVGDLGAAVREAGLHYGLYHSLYEWFNPLYIEDKRSGFTTQNYIKTKMMPELMELVTKYKPDIVWSDGQFEAPCSYWNCTQFLSWLYNESPVKDTVVTNDRWGTDVLCKHGGYLTCADRYIPDKNSPGRKWENCLTIDRESWGYRRNAILGDYFEMESLLLLLAQTLSKGGNFLMNIGPTAEGTIPAILEERLLQMGSWLKVNGEAVYDTTAWTVDQDPTNENVYYTLKSTADGPVLFVLLMKWPQGDRLELTAPRPSQETQVTWLGYLGAPIVWEKSAGGGMVLNLPKVSVLELPCQWAWSFRVSKLLNAIS